MINNQTHLKKLCKVVSQFYTGKAVPAQMSERMYETLTKWQFSNKYPNLLSFFQGRNHFLVRVR